MASFAKGSSSASKAPSAAANAFQSVDLGGIRDLDPSVADGFTVVYDREVPLEVRLQVRDGGWRRKEEERERQREREREREEGRGTSVVQPKAVEDVGLLNKAVLVVFRAGCNMRSRRLRTCRDEQVRSRSMPSFFLLALCPPTTYASPSRLHV